jgi:hypothetical protein
MADLIKTDGTRCKISPKNGEWFTLEELYDYIDCGMVELIYLNNSAHDEGDPEGKILIGDEEARLKPFADINIDATIMYRMSWEVGSSYHIFGNVILCKSKEFR